MATKILSSDILIADLMVPLPYRTKKDIERIETENPKLAGKYTDVDTLSEPQRSRYKQLNTKLDSILGEKGVTRGNKVAITKQQFAELSAMMNGIPNEGVAAGGSSANTLSTLSRLLGPEHVEVSFLGVTNEGQYSQIIQSGLNEARIKLIPDSSSLPHDLNPESAFSFVFNGPEGKTTVTYPGNAKEILKPEMLTDELIAGHDVIFLQGSLWEKFARNGRHTTSLPDVFMQKRWQHDKELWLALPTHAKFSDKMTPEDYRFIIPSADVVVANEVELMRIYETNDFEHAKTQLQKALGQRDAIRQQHGLPPRRKPAKALITHGEEPAASITPAGITKINVDPTDAQPIYVLGAGDTSFAGFFAGHIAGLSPEESGRLAVELARTKLPYNSARIPGETGPRDELEQGRHQARAIWAKARTALEQQLGRAAG